MRRRLGAVVTAVVLSGTVACGASPPGDSGPGGPGEAAGYPMTVENCGRQVTIEAPPQRIFALGGEPGTMLWAAGGAQRISTMAPIEGEPLGAATADLSQRPQLVIPGSAEGDLSREAIIAAQPDLVVAFDLNLTTPEDLAAAGIPTLLISARCDESPLRGFDAVFADIELYGRVLGTPDRAAAAIADLRGQVDAARQRALEATAGRSAAALFVNGGPDTALGAYGARSMVHQQLEILGLRDVFTGTDQRYFEPSTESLIAARPDVIIALHQASDQLDEPAARDAVLARPELATLPAVETGTVLGLDYFYAGDGILAVEGLQRLADQLATPR